MEAIKNELEKKYENAWEKYTSNDLEKVFKLSDRYREFMSKCKTERECVIDFIKEAEKNGYENLDPL